MLGPWTRGWSTILLVHGAGGHLSFGRVRQRGGSSQHVPRRDRAALYHGGSPVELMRGQTVDRLYLKFRDDRPRRIESELTLPNRGQWKRAAREPISKSQG